MKTMLADDSLPSISIVTPSFNHGKFIEYTLLSVLEQDYPRSKIQYIVMDGGSKDQTLDILNRYNAEISYWQSEPDGGQAEAINSGMERAEGEIVAWLNSDDIYLPGVFLEVAKIMQDSSIDATSSNAYHYNTNRQKLFKVEGMQPRLWLLRLYGNYIAQPTCFWRRTALHSVNALRRDLQRFLDYDLQMRLLKEGIVYKYIKKFRSIIIWHGDNKCATLHPEAEWENLTTDHKLPPKIFQRYVGKFLLMNMHLFSGNREYVRSIFKQRIRNRGHGELLGVEVPTEEIHHRISTTWEKRLLSLKNSTNQ